MIDNIIIIGAGLAGISAAEALRQSGFGGTIDLMNGETHQPYDRPPLSKEVLTATRSVEEIRLRPDAFYERNGINLMPDCRATTIDRQGKRVVTNRHTEHLYSYLIIATGSRPRRLSVPGSSEGASPKVMYLRDLDDSVRIRERLVSGGHLLILGAGFIGLEVAANARRLGNEVTVVEATAGALHRVAPPVVSDFVRSAHEASGVRFKFGGQVIGMAEDAGSVTLECADGERVTGNSLLISIGSIPNEEIAKDCGLSCDNGIVVNACCRTADESVYAVGDVARCFSIWEGRHVRSEHWECARKSGIAAARSICGAPTTNDSIPWVWSDQGDLNLQFIGWPDQQAAVTIRGQAGAPQWSALQTADGQLRSAALVNSGRDRRHLQKLISSGTRVPLSKLADESIPLRQWVK